MSEDYLQDKGDILDFLKKECDRLKPVVRGDLQRLICGNNINYMFAQEYVNALFYHETLKGHHEECRELTMYMERFASQEMSPPLNPELMYMLLRICHYDIEGGKFPVKAANSPTEACKHMYM